MGAALVALAALPLVVTPLADPYQPIRTLVAVLAAGLLVISGVRREGGRARVARILGLVLGIWVLGAAVLNGPASAVYGVHGRYQGLVSGAMLLVCGAAGLSLRGRDMRTFARGLVIVAAFVSATVILQAALGSDPVAWMNNRVVTGGWLSVAAGVGAAWVAITSGRTRTAAVGSLALVMLALGLVASRGAWLAAGAGLLVVVLTFGGSRGSMLRFAAPAMLALTIIGAIMGGPQAISKLDPSGLTAGSAMSRSQIWSGTLAMIAEHPLTGVGPGRFLYGFPGFQPVAHAVTESVDTRPDQAHSWPLQLSAESGVPAGIAVVALSVLALTAVRRRDTRRDGAALLALGGFSAYVVQAIFSVPAVEVDALGWLLGGVLISRGARMAEDIPAGAIRHRLVPLILSGSVVVASVIFMVADSSHVQAVRAFSVGDFTAAERSSRLAIELNPLVDVYRVAYADAAIFEPEPDRRQRAAERALPVVREGLRLEPASFDLALAAARLTAASGATEDEVADAYLAAVALYPLGIEVREHAADALDRAGREAESEAMRREIRELLTARGDGA